MCNKNANQVIYYTFSPVPRCLTILKTSFMLSKSGASSIATASANIDGYVDSNDLEYVILIEFLQSQEIVYNVFARLKFIDIKLLSGFLS